MMKKGASIIWAIIIAGVLLIVSSTTAAFIVKESQMGVRMDDSAKAYAAAESGVDWAKSCISDTTGCFAANIQPTLAAGFSRTFKIEGVPTSATYTVKVSGGPAYQIQSRGTSGPVNRQLEYTYTLDPGGEFDATQPLVISNTNSFSMNFRYWAPTNALTGAKLGLLGSDKHFLGVMINGASMDLDAEVDPTVAAPAIPVIFHESFPSNTTASGPITIPSAPTNYLTATYGVEIALDYVKDSSLRLTVLGDNGTGNTVCLGTKTWFIDSGFRMPASADLVYFATGSRVGSPLLSGTQGDPGFTNVGTNGVVNKASVGASYAYMVNFFGRGIRTVNTYSLNLSVTPPSPLVGGVVTKEIQGASWSSTPATTFTDGSVVRLTAAELPGWSFGGWTGCPTAGTSGKVCTVTMTSPQTITANFTLNPTWLSVGAFQVYSVDLPVLAWGPLEECKTANHTTLGSDCSAASNLITGAKNLFASYPAQQACINVGGRLPTVAELGTMYANKAALGGFNSFWYWSSTQFSTTQASYKNFLNGTTGQYQKDSTSSTFAIRCVKP